MMNKKIIIKISTNVLVTSNGIFGPRVFIIIKLANIEIIIILTENFGK